MDVSAWTLKHKCKGSQKVTNNISIFKGQFEDTEPEEKVFALRIAVSGSQQTGFNLYTPIIYSNIFSQCQIPETSSSCSRSRTASAKTKIGAKRMKKNWQHINLKQPFPGLFDLWFCFCISRKAFSCAWCRCCGGLRHHLRNQIQLNEAWVCDFKFALIFVYTVLCFVMFFDVQQVCNWFHVVLWTGASSWTLTSWLYWRIFIWWGLGTQFCASLVMFFSAQHCATDFMW